MAITNSEALRRYRAKNPEKVRQLTRDWVALNKPQVARYSREYNLRRKGFTVDSYAITRAIQKEACAICKQPFDQMESRKVHADHDHASSMPRGVLCHFCNVGLGVFKDSPLLLEAAAIYLANPTMKATTMLEPKVDELKIALQKNTDTLLLLITALANFTASPAVPKSQAAQAAVASGPTTAPAVEVVVPLPTIEESPPAAASVVAASPASTAADSPLMTYEVVAKAITDGVKKDRVHVVALLAKYNAKRGTDLKPEQYAAFLAELS